MTASGGTWNTASLTVGISGTGTLNLEPGGVITVGNGMVTLGSVTNSLGTLNYGGGTLGAGVVTTGSGTGIVNFVNTGTVTFAPQITGSTRVNQTGAGTTILTATNTYTG